MEQEAGARDGEQEMRDRRRRWERWGERWESINAGNGVFQVLV